MKKIFLSMLISLAVFSCQKENTVSPTMDAEIEELAKSVLIYGESPGIEIGITKNGQKKIYSFGTENLSTGKPFDEFSIFEIGSISKTFTALLYADLILKNKISLNDSANKYLPASMQLPSKDGTSIKIVNLLNHTSGIPRMPVDFPRGKDADYSEYGEEKMSAYLKNLTLLSTPGTTLEYSNTAVGLAGYMLKQITGNSFGEQVKAKIFKPLGMNYTYTEYIDPYGSKTVQGYMGSKPVNFIKFSNVFESAGCIKSNMHDMFIYMNNAMNTENSIFKNEFELAQKPTFNIESNSQVGLNWFTIIKNDSNPIIWHNGGTNGFNTFLGFDKKSKNGVMIAANSFTGGSLNNIGFGILKILAKYP